MPSLAPRLCQCGRPVPAGKRCVCKAEATVQYDRQRGSADKRGYDNAWRLFRMDRLAANPWCQSPGCANRSKEVHHIQSVRDRPDLRLDWQNTICLCKPCHSRITATTQGFARNKRGSKP
ncbi:HNH endonuclease signature motif containing protein [Rhizobium puerariae]|uniref:HNH endonuclease signature motif containing protein n=1 Tax=Rhizobium puerariae TaxID=1585791 RepID=UPI00367361C7